MGEPLLGGLGGQEPLLEGMGGWEIEVAKPAPAEGILVPKREKIKIKVSPKIQFAFLKVVLGLLVQFGEITQKEADQTIEMVREGLFVTKLFRLTKEESFTRFVEELRKCLKIYRMHRAMERLEEFERAEQLIDSISMSVEEDEEEEPEEENDEDSDEENETEEEGLSIF